MYWLSNKYPNKQLFCSFWIFCLSFIILLLSNTIEAKPVEVKTLIPATEVSDEWTYHSGDNKEWAKPEFDDSTWTKTNIAKSWKENNLGGFFWYRKEIIFSQDIGKNQLIDSLAIQIAQMEYGAYEIYANGEKIASFGTFPPNNTMPLASPMVFYLPQKAVESGRILLAIRIWKDPKYLKRAKFYFSKHEDFQDKFAISTLDSLKDKLQLIRQSKLQDDVVKLYMTIFFTLISLYHFQLYFGRKQLSEYFWFGLFSIGFAVNVFFNSAWSLEIVSGFSAFFIRVFSRQILVIPCFQFFWVFLSLPIKRWIRLIQASQVLFLLIICIWPDVILTPFNTVMFLSIIAVVFFPLIFTLKEMRRGNPEASVMIFGLVMLTVVEIIEVIRFIGLVKIPLVAHWGFAGLILSIAVALSKRFNRVHTELDTLNHELETKVTNRTAELAQTNEELAGTNNKLANTISQLQEAQAETERKNQELDKKIKELNEKNQQLIASQQQADRIFSALAEALPGTVLDGKYRLEEKIGSGGYGAVFKAIHVELNTAIAVKVFRPTEGNDSPEAIERFKLEGVSACKVNHPNAINVLDSGISSEGIAYIAMELLVGHTLKDEMLTETTLPLKRCAEIIIPVCQALGEAHKAGIVHRDIKPDNIFLHQGKQGEVVKVVDFGIAKLIEEQNEDKQSNLTESGSIVGTPIYMAPERLKSQPYDGRADVYSLGIMLYEMLTGKKPFQITGNNVIEIILKHIKETPTILSEYIPNIPKSVENIVMDTLEKNPNKRPTALEFAKTFSQEISNLEKINPEILLAKATCEKKPRIENTEDYTDKTMTHFSAKIKKTNTSVKLPKSEQETSAISNKALD